MAYAEEIGALYLETSAKDDTNVQDIFVKLSKSPAKYSKPTLLLRVILLPLGPYVLYTFPLCVTV